MNLSDYDFDLPKELIADRPRRPRGTSKLLVIEKKTGKIKATTFNRIFDYFSRKDLFIFNDTKVNPVSLSLNDEFGKRYKILLVEEVNKNVWKILTKKPKMKIFKFSDGLKCEIFNDPVSKEWFIKFNSESKLFIDRFGMMPIPPYLNREPDINDFVDYQTVYAKKEGSIAAPTAGLHFTKDLMKKIRMKDIGLEFLTLHVGMGTFLPIKDKIIENHKMHYEEFFISSKLISEIELTKRGGNRILTVGTTTLRALESYNLFARPSDSWFKTDIFINQGFEFGLTDALLTNFHLPKSSLLVLISSFLGYELTKLSYEYAIKEKFKFYSYGDAMLIV